MFNLWFSMLVKIQFYDICTVIESIHDVIIDRHSGLGNLQVRPITTTFKIHRFKTILCRRENEQKIYEMTTVSIINFTFNISIMGHYISFIQCHAAVWCAAGNTPNYSPAEPPSIKYVSNSSCVAAGNFQTLVLSLAVGHRLWGVLQ